MILSDEGASLACLHPQDCSSDPADEKLLYQYFPKEKNTLKNWKENCYFGEGSPGAGGQDFFLHWDFLPILQFSSVAQSCPTLCDPMNRSTPGLPVHQPTPRVYLDSRPLSQWCHPAISSSVVPFSSCPQSLPGLESFPMSQLFAWGSQSISP